MTSPSFGMWPPQPVSPVRSYILFDGSADAVGNRLIADTGGIVTSVSRNGVVPGLYTLVLNLSEAQIAGVQHWGFVVGLKTEDRMASYDLNADEDGSAITIRVSDAAGDAADSAAVSLIVYRA